MAKAKLIRIGIAGQGRSGHDIHYALGVSQLPELFKVVAVADLLPERRQQAETETGARTYADYREMLKAGDFDLFVNALPSAYHYEGTMAALKAGFHVLSEKPLARTAKEVDTMVAAAKKSRRILQPFQNSRFLPDFQKALEIASSGILGDIVKVNLNWSGFGRRWDWQTYQANLGGNLYNTGPHPMDHAIMFFGEKKTPKVFCRMASHHAFGGDAEDFCDVTLYGGPKDPVVQVLISSCLAYPLGERYNIQGTRGGLTGGPNGLAWKYFDPKKAPKQKPWPRWSLERKYCGESLPWVEEKWTPPEDVLKNPFLFGVKSLYTNLHGVLTGMAKPVVKIEQVRKQIAAIEECHRQNPLPRKRAKATK